MHILNVILDFFFWQSFCLAWFEDFLAIYIFYMYILNVILDFWQFFLSSLVWGFSRNIHFLHVYSKCYFGLLSFFV
jgi:hypothetical protein